MNGINKMWDERVDREHWSLNAEKDFLDNLGGWNHQRKPALTRRRLLRNYIKAAELRVNCPSWWDEAVDYARELLKKRG